MERSTYLRSKLAVNTNTNTNTNTSTCQKSKIEENYGKINYSKLYQMQTNQRDSLSDLKKTLFDLDTSQWSMGEME